MGVEHLLRDVNDPSVSSLANQVNKYHSNHDVLLMFRFCVCVKEQICDNVALPVVSSSDQT